MRRLRSSISTPSTSASGFNQPDGQGGYRTRALRPWLRGALCGKQRSLPVRRQRSKEGRRKARMGWQRARKGKNKAREGRQRAREGRQRAREGRQRAKEGKTFGALGEDRQKARAVTTRVVTILP